MIVPVILSGGSGTRLWPLSREAFPKQFLGLLGERSLFQDTLSRLQTLPACGAPMLVCNIQHRFLVAEQLRLLGVDDATIVLEPEGRNTAPAAASAALIALARDPNAMLLVLPADHLIRHVEAFHACLAVGMQAAQKGHLVTFGVVAERAETGFGYIRRGPPPAWSVATETPSLFMVDAFVEKPDQATAEAYVAEGNYDWNSGMFLFRADRFLQELARVSPAIFHACQQAVDRARVGEAFTILDKAAFLASPKDSIDYAVMEKTAASVVVPLRAGWNDIGSWLALWEEGTKDTHGNVVSGDVWLEGVNNCLIRSESRLVAAIGLDDHVIVETADALFVSHKGRVQDVKTVVNRLQAGGREEVGSHRKVYRPWGSYEAVDRSQRFQVKRIVVHPGATLSLQMHHHRAEHWIVVKGTARVTKGEEQFLLSEDQSTYIPLGVVHRLENPGTIPLELIEVQSGSYLGEDDIVRLDDQYGRGLT